MNKKIKRMSKALTGIMVLSMIALLGPAVLFQAPARQVKTQTGWTNDFRAAMFGSYVAQAAEDAHTGEEHHEEKSGKDGGSPWKPMAAAMAVSVTALATAYAQSKIGAAGMGALAEKPETAPMIIVLEALPETIVILGFVVAAMIIMF